MKAAVIIGLLALAGTARANELQVFAGGELSSGQDPFDSGTSQVGAKFDQYAFALGAAFVFGADTPTAFGVRPLLHIGMELRFYGSQGRTLMDGTVVDPDLTPNAATSYLMALPFGTYVPFFTRDGFELQASFGADARLGNDRESDSAETLGFAGGVRADIGAPDGKRVIASYEIAPFWFGTDRIEHRVQVEATLGRFGVMARYTHSQLRGDVSGFSANIAFVALELRI